MVILIAHRGNLNGPNPLLENNPIYIQRAIDEGFNVEIDVWKLDNDKWFLGHDKPQYEIKFDYLKNNKFWSHAKNINAFNDMLADTSSQINCFWHENDQYTLTSNKLIWTYPGNELSTNSICVMPEWNNDLYNNKEKFNNCRGICTDYIFRYNNLFKK
jgi:hypothetical protein